MTTRVSYKPSHEWLQALWRPLRVPLVFMLSGLASFCAFQDSDAVTGRSAASASVTIALWDADLMPAGDRLAVREKMSHGFAKAVSPDVLVVYDVPQFDQLLKLRNALGLYGYTAVMSNFSCGRTPKGAHWPFEVAVLSRYPINQAVQYDPPGKKTAACGQRMPVSDGPVVDQRLPMKLAAGDKWPKDKRGHPLAGPGLLSVRIDSASAAIVAVRVPAVSEYPGADPAALATMRRVLAGAAHAWMAAEHKRDQTYHLFAMGDFGFDPGVSSAAVREGRLDGPDSGDSVDRIMRGEVSNSGAPGRGAVSLTHQMFERGLSPGVFPHSDRIFLWQDGLQAFGPAQRAENSFGSRAFPLVVRSSGASCAIDPGVRLRRKSPVFLGFTHQVFAASEIAFLRQMRALHGASGASANWIVSIDLDDVVLDNSSLLYRLAVQCKQPTASDWYDWIGSGHAKLTAGAREFLRMLRAKAAASGGRIVLMTSLPPDLRSRILSDLTRLGVTTGPNDSVVKLAFAPTAAARDAQWHELTGGGARIVLVLGARADQFPDDPKLPVGGSARSCRNDSMGEDGRLEIFGSQTARFGVCYFLLPVHVL